MFVCLFVFFFLSELGLIFACVCVTIFFRQTETAFHVCIFLLSAHIIPGIVTVDMPVTRSKKQTVTGLRELCDEAHITFIDEVLKNKCPFGRSILPLIALLILG